MTLTRLACLSAIPLLLLASGCSDGGDTVIARPSRAAITGTWGTTATESLDTCGFVPPPSFEPVFIEEAGDAAAVFTFVDASGACVDSVREREGNVVMLNHTDTFDGGCGLVQVQSNIVYTFTNSSFSGTSNHHYTLVTGFCSNLPCDYQMTVAGTRCDDCWRGCFSAAGDESPAPAETPGILSSPLAPRF